jgi:flagellar protein FlaG
MNIINPQNTSSDVQRSEAPGGKRTESELPGKNGNRLPNNEAIEVSTVKPKAEADVLREELTNAVAKLNDYIQTVQRDLQFTLDEGSGQSVITVVDRKSAEVIRQIPTELTLDLARKLNNQEPLFLFSARV